MQFTSHMTTALIKPQTENSSLSAKIYRKITPNATGNWLKWSSQYNNTNICYFTHSIVIVVKENRLDVCYYLNYFNLIVL